VRNTRALWIAAAMTLPAIAGAADNEGAPLRLSFAETVRLAAGQTPAAKIAGLQTDAARSRLTQSRAAFLPQLNGSASQTNMTSNLAAFGLQFPAIPGTPPIPELIGPFDLFDARLTASQTVFDWSSVQKVQAAKEGLSATRADQTATFETAARDAAMAYLRALRAQALLDARAEDLEIADSLLSLAQAQVSAGVSPGIDLTRARTAQASARGALLVARNQVDRAQVDIARSLGLDPSQRFELTDSLSTTLGETELPTESAAALAAAFEHRPELAAATARKAEAERSRSAITAERMPKLSINGDVGLSGPTPDEAITTRGVSVGVTMPVFDGLRREGRIQEQQAQVQQRDIRIHDLRDQVSAEVRASLLDLGSGLGQEDVASERLSLAEDELDQARDRFVNGVAGNIEVINAQASLVLARNAEIDARFAVATARVNLARAAGVTQTLR